MSLHKTEYTGKNRCWPCTVLNCGLAAMGAIVIATLGRPVFAAVGFTVALASIVYRGYFIPWTPELTRYFPNSVLVWLNRRDSVSTRKPVTVPRSGGVLEGDGELSITSDAREHIQNTASIFVKEQAQLEQTFVEVFPRVTEISVRRNFNGGENWFALDDSTTTLLQWNTRSVAALDAAGAEYLTSVLPDWTIRSLDERRTMLALLRYGATACPSCGTEYEAVDGPRVTCCGGRSLVGERRCEECEYILVDRNDLPTNEVLMENRSYETDD